MSSLLLCNSFFLSPISGLIELDQELLLSQSPPGVSSSLTSHLSPIVTNTTTRKAKSPTQGVHFSPTVDTSEGTFLYAQYQSDSSDHGSDSGGVDIYDSGESPVNTPLPVSVFISLVMIDIFSCIVIVGLVQFKSFYFYFDIP